MHTARVMAGSQEDTASGITLADYMAGGWGGKNAILADEKLLDPVGGANLGNQLDDFGIPETTIASDDEKRAWISISGVLAS
jgi:hypothetical protein